MLISELLGIELPIIQAPMAGVQNWALAAAVSNGGGLGSIPCAMLNPEQLTAELKNYRAASTKPVNLNFFCHTMAPLDQAQLDRWQAVLAPYYDEYAVEPPTSVGALRTPFGQETADTLKADGPPVVSFHFGLPNPELMDQIKSWGAVVMSSATSIAEAKWLADHGADVIIAQGIEAGGHQASFLEQSVPLGAYELLRECLQAVSLPVVSAGGIASRAEVKARIGEGAAGVQVGTSYLLCEETKTSELHRAALQDQSRSTALTNVFSGRPARGIRNRLMQDLDDLCEDAPSFPYAAIGVNPLKVKAEATGSDDFTSLWSGENRSGCKLIPAAELTRSLWFEEG